LLKKYYSDAQYLLLGAANHSNTQHHLYLIDLLKSVGHDPKLKYIVLEQFRENDDFYRRLSREGIEAVLKDYTFDGEHQKQMTLCWSNEWTWVYTHLFPVIQQINKERAADNPLLVRAMDGFHLSWPIGLTSLKDVKTEDCSFRLPVPQNTTDNIQNREEGTATNFYNEIATNLASDDKVIVLYHQNHLWKHFESCRVTRTDDGPVSKISPRTWFGALLRDHPEIEERTRLVVFDEIDEGHHPYGVLRFTKRQSDRYPGEAWAIDMRNLQGVETQQNQNAFLFSPVGYSNEGLNYTDTRYRNFDGIVYSPNASRDTRVTSVSTNMGATCPNGSYDGNSLYPHKGWFE
jgi:hypothetical protein